MDAERQLIGSLLIDQTRINNIRTISPEMFIDSTMGMIFSIYANAEGKEVNQLLIVPKIITSYRTEQQSFELLAELVMEHDAGTSDEFCERVILQNYKARKINEIIEHSFINAENADDFMDDIIKLSESLQQDIKDDTVCIGDLVELSSNYFTEKNAPKYEFGFPSIDKAVGGIDDGDTIIIAARPSVGKSAFALQIGRKFGREGKKVGYFNLEMGKKQIYERAIASASGIEMSRIRLATNFLNDEQKMFEDGNEKLSKERNFFIITGTQTVKKIRAKQQKEKYDIIIIDYMQLIVSSGNRNGNRASEVGDISRGLKAIALDFSIPVICLSQLNRASERTKDKEPSLADLRESGDIEQDASVVLMMWNSNDDDKCEKTAKIEKSRNGYNERAVLYFDGKHMRFEEDQPEGFRDVRESDDLAWD